MSCNIIRRRLKSFSTDYEDYCLCERTLYQNHKQLRGYLPLILTGSETEIVVRNFIVNHLISLTHDYFFYCDFNVLLLFQWFFICKNNQWHQSNINGNINNSRISSSNNRNSNSNNSKSNKNSKATATTTTTTATTTQQQQQQ